MKRTGLACAAIAWALASGIVAAQTTSSAGQGPSGGPAMMRGYGNGMGGYGPGMMGGYGYGMGGYGPGMMGGYGYGMGGYGPGMMGGYGYGMGGYGPGMMGGRNVLSRLDLTADQQEKIAQIREDMRAKNWGTMGELRTEQFRLRNLYNADKPDASAIGEQQKKVDELRRTMIKSHIDARNQIAALLTKEQRQQLRAMSTWWLDEEDDGN